MLRLRAIYFILERKDLFQKGKRSSHQAPLRRLEVDVLLAHRARRTRDGPGEGRRLPLPERAAARPPGAVQWLRAARKRGLDGLRVAARRLRKAFRGLPLAGAASHKPL